MATIYQKRTALKRKTSDIERLAKQYQQQIGQLTSEYETQYGQFQAESQAKTSEYEKQAAAYGQAFTDYQKNVLAPYQSKFEAYKTSLESYNKQVEEFNKTVPYDLMSYNIGRYPYVDINGKPVNVRDMMRDPKSYGFESVSAAFDIGLRGVPELVTLYPIQTVKDPGDFTGAPPKAPEAFSGKAPTAPELGSFDTTQFDEKRGQLEQTFKREVGERRAGRLAAVSRKSARPLLQGA